MKILKFTLMFVLCSFFLAITANPVFSNGISGEETYKKLSAVAKGIGDVSLIEKLNADSRKLAWETAVESEFDGNLRLLKTNKSQGAFNKDNLYLIRNVTGEVYVLSIPKDMDSLKEDSGSPYIGIDSLLQNKAIFTIKKITGTVENVKYEFAMLIKKPYQSAMDRIFKIAMVSMLFLVMIGMGMTLTRKDFELVVKQPRGVVFGTVLQFGLMPLVSLGVAHLLGFYDNYPFIYVGMILVTSTPGGATSNLMTYFAKGDLALSISLTSFSTALSIFFTPLILTLYCVNVPEVNMPVKMIVGSIFVLVLVPLLIGMSINYKWKKFAEKATPIFSALGIIAVLFIIVAGVISNLHVFVDTERYGVHFYSMVFCLTFIGMLFGAILTKAIGVNNYQTRAVSMEIGIRNVSLSMVIALLIQDYMGDFYSSMFVTSGIFGLFMYIAGIISIQVYKKFLPVEDVAEEIPIDSTDEV
ncbi:MAG: bile acid:sodium symporter family protein [bacterium]|nr:bile acid:sodium symporter family protein [bacterium]